MQNSGNDVAGFLIAFKNLQIANVAFNVALYAMLHEIGSRYGFTYLNVALIFCELPIMK